MTINLYLNNKVRESPGFKSERYSDNSGDNITFNGTHVSSDKGRLYLMWSEDRPISDELKDLVEEISCYETIPQMGRRESGIYRYETAECELTPGDYGNAKREKPVYKLKITAKNPEDIKVIMHKVKTGTIRPEESYEGHQQGKSRSELERQLEETEHYKIIYCDANKRLNADMVALRQDFARVVKNNEGLREQLKLSEDKFRTHQQNFTNACEKNVRIRQLARGLDNPSALPFVLRSTVAKQIDAVLDDTK